MARVKKIVAINQTYYWSEMIVVGLTGGIAMGKSNVTKTFRQHNILVIDADIVARQVVEPGTVGLHQVINFFGKQFLLSNGKLDREALGKLVFSNLESLSILNKIMLPLIDNAAQQQFTKLQEQGCKLCVFDAALIIEAGHADRYRPLIVVHCSREAQIQRLIKRNRLTHREAMDRINAQLPIEQKMSVADYTIDTNGSIENSRCQTEKIIYELERVYCGGK